MAEVELFTTRRSPYGQRVQIALTEKKIPFQITLVDFSNKPQALLEANPIHNKVPTILHNGRPVAESLVILEYLEDAFPEHPLTPKDAYEKSKVRFWVDYIDKAQSTWNASYMTKPGTPERQAANEAVLTTLKTLDKGITTFSPDGPLFAGSKFGLLDVVLAPLCNALVVMKELNGIVVPGPEELPRLHKWLEAVKVHPSVSSTLPSADELLATWQRRQRSLA